MNSAEKSLEPRPRQVEEIENVLLITSTLQPSGKVPFLHLRDPNERLFQTLCGLIAWIEETPLKHFVLCDNSKSSGLLTDMVAHARTLGKELELIDFSGDAGMAIAKGKGYGEGEIVAYALAHSAMLQNCKSFYKITGRTFIKNFNVLHAHNEKDPVVFAFGGVRWVNWFLGRLFQFKYLRRYEKRRRVRTLFYKSSPEFFRRKLIDRYAEVDDHSGRWLENVYYPVCVRHGTSFFQRLVIVGMRGTTGENYSESTFSDEVCARARAMLRNVDFANGKPTGTEVAQQSDPDRPQNGTSRTGQR